MTMTAESGFTASEFAELRAITAELHGEWFPQWEGVHVDDLPAQAAKLAVLHRLVTTVIVRNEGVEPLQAGPRLA